MVGRAGDDDNVGITRAPDNIIWLDAQETDVDDLVIRSTGLQTCKNVGCGRWCWKSSSNWQLRALDHIEASAAPPIVDIGHWSLNPQAVRSPHVTQSVSGLIQFLQYTLWFQHRLQFPFMRQCCLRFSVVWPEVRRLSLRFLEFAFVFLVGRVLVCLEDGFVSGLAKLILEPIPDGLGLHLQHLGL
jgi:hypothetical protein